MLDEKLQFGLVLAASPRVEKFRIIDNLPGTPNFCPLVRKTSYLERMIGKRLRERACETLGIYDPQLVQRAAAYLYLKETHSSFEVDKREADDLKGTALCRTAQGRRDGPANGRAVHRLQTP